MNKYASNLNSIRSHGLLLLSSVEYQLSKQLPRVEQDVTLSPIKCSGLICQAHATQRLTGKGNPEMTGVEGAGKFVRFQKGVRYIGVLLRTSYCNWAEESFAIPGSSLYQGFHCTLFF